MIFSHRPAPLIAPTVALLILLGVLAGAPLGAQELQSSGEAPPSSQPPTNDSTTTGDVATGDSPGPDAGPDAASEARPADDSGTPRVPPVLDDFDRSERSRGGLVEWHEAYYVLDALNEGVVWRSEPPNRQTPQATLEHFIRSCRESRFHDAAWALNLNLFPEADQDRMAAILSRQLFYLLDQQVTIAWDSLPDRPDGMSSRPSLGTQATDPGPQRSIRLGSIQADGRDYVFRLQRVKVEDDAPVWVFSPSSIENVPALYDRFGPGWLAQRLPLWAEQELFGDMPIGKWLALLGLIAISIGFGYMVRRLARHLWGDVDEPWLRGLVHTILTPIAVVAMVALVYGVARGGLALTGDYSSFVYTTLLVLLILSITWLCMRVIKYLSDYVLERYVDDLEEENDSQGQRYATYVSVLRRIAIVVIFFVGAGILVAQFRSLQALGFSLLASAGVASVIFGIAAQSTLGNIIAGLQIGLTGPVRIGDSVNYADNWGWVEEINYTYLTVRTWDHRRLIVPLKYLIDHPLENWTKNNAHILKPIHLHCDFHVDVQAVRERFAELLEAHEEYDGENEPQTEVVELTEDGVVIRCVASAKDPSTAWSLHCDLREQMLEYMMSEQSRRAMPRDRVELVEVDERERSSTERASDERSSDERSSDERDESSDAEAADTTAAGQKEADEREADEKAAAKASSGS